MGTKNENIHLFLLEQNRTISRLERASVDILPKPVLQKPIWQPSATMQAAPALIEEPVQVASAPTAVLGPLSFLEKLSKEEITLRKERDELMRNRQMLRQRIVEQVEIRKCRIEQSKAEILDLKQKCQILSTALGTSMQNN